MKILRDVSQGSPEWLAVRARHRCASDAPAVMGEGLTSRSELVRIKATGDERAFSDYVREHVLERGHEVEALMRPIVESELGEDLYPVTATDDAGKHLASFDGMVMSEEESWEHKQWNEALAEAVRAGSSTLPGGLHWQLEHQLLVGAPTLKRIRFTVSGGTTDKRAEMIYEAVPGRRERLVAAWKQFEEDVANYQHVETPAKAAPTLEATLPVVQIEVRGHVDLASNLRPWGEQLRAFIAEIPKAPATDEEFANCEAAVKALKTAEERLELAESAALAKFESIDAMRTEAAMLKELARATRLAVDKLVEERKKQIRDEIRQEGVRAFAAHVEKLNVRLGRQFMPPITPDFAGKMKGKKTVASLRDAISTELARAKLEANDVADKIEANLKVLAEHAGGFEFLFHDLSHLVLKEAGDFALLVRARVADHQRAEEERARARADAERVVTSAPAAETTKPSQPALAVRAPVGATGRPSDAQIVAALVQAFGATEAQVISWLRAMDLSAERSTAVAH